MSCCQHIIFKCEFKLIALKKWFRIWDKLLGGSTQIIVFLAVALILHFRHSILACKSNEEINLCVSKVKWTLYFHAAPCVILNNTRSTSFFLPFRWRKKRPKLLLMKQLNCGKNTADRSAWQLPILPNKNEIYLSLGDFVD